VDASTDAGTEMPKKILVLGAGASLGAREGERVRPPAGQELARYLRSWLKANDPYKTRTPVSGHPSIASRNPYYVGEALWDLPVWTEANRELRRLAGQERRLPRRGTPFEALMKDLSKAGFSKRPVLELIQRLIAYSMNFGYRNAFIEHGDLFDDLLRVWGPDAIVTVNYDLLVEQALQRLHLRYSYLGLPGPASKPGYVSPGDNGNVVPIFKLHGSVNWLAPPTGGAGASEEAARKEAEARSARGVKSGPLDALQGRQGTFVSPNAPTLRMDLEKDRNRGPIIAVYGPGKHFLQNPEDVDSHRRSCLEYLGSHRLGDVLAVGIKPATAKDDPVLRSVLRALVAATGSKRYVSPSPSDCRAFARFGFRTRKETLAQFMTWWPRPPKRKVRRRR
jgi:hypothetical protein